MTFSSRPKKPGNKAQKLNKINVKTDSLRKLIISAVPSESIAEWPGKEWLSREKGFYILAIGL